jgi:hypothetical protein
MKIPGVNSMLDTYLDCEKCCRLLIASNPCCPDFEGYPRT